MKRPTGVIARIMPGAAVSTPLLGLALMCALLGSMGVRALLAVGETPWSGALWRAVGGSATVVTVASVVAFPIALGVAIYLEELARRSRLVALLEWNINLLAGVPPLVYGLFGVLVFVRGLALGRSNAAGAATLALLMLPELVVTLRLALRQVPVSAREAALALGATRLELVRHVVLHAAWPRLVTSAVLAVSKALGEAAALLALGAFTLVIGGRASDGLNPTAPLVTLPTQIYAALLNPEGDRLALALAGIFVLLAWVLGLNLVALAVRLLTRRPS